MFNICFSNNRSEIHKGENSNSGKGNSNEIEVLKLPNVCVSCGRDLTALDSRILNIQENRNQPYESVPKFLFPYICLTGFVEVSGRYTRISYIFTIFLLLVCADIFLTHGIFFDQRIIKIYLPYLTSYLLTVTAWGTLRRKKRQLTTVLGTTRDLKLYAHDKMVNFIAIMICIVTPIISILLTFLLNKSNQKRFFYGFEVENYWSKIAIMSSKNALYFIIYPCITHAIALLYCVLCLRCSNRINCLCQKITQCSPGNFGIPKQQSILKNRTQVRDILLEVQAVFSVPIFCTIVGNILMCASVIGWYLVKKWDDSDIAWKMKIAFYVINAFSNVMATTWVASESAISMKKFKETFNQKTQKRLLYYDPKGEQYLKADLLAEPDFVLTGCDIISFKRSTILALVGTLLTYTVLLMNTN
ncbi:hypothetical protein AVEN_238246-1 [Araneus ventricosus]|uniref:Gustatory receptor n=1 Tax=Araneus ventricosus TaxID=182803 RepID=A0A4Y2N3A9_ARAVE|nr:hypothetical protein AVEN_238246-1 [Araneus ventricosus]